MTRCISSRAGKNSRRTAIVDPSGRVPTYEAGDLMMVAVLRMLGGTPLLDAHPTLTEYVARVEARPAFARALADQMVGFTGAPPPAFAAWLAAQGETG